MKKGLLLITIFFCLEASSLAQVFNPWGPPPNHKEIKPNFIRFLLSHLSGEVSLGYGNTRYYQNLDNQTLYSSNDQLYLTASDSTGNGYYLIDNWINKPQIVDSVNNNTPILFQLGNTEYDPNADFLIDSLQRRLRGGGHSFPISFKGYITYDRYRIGGGATFSLNREANLSLSGYPDYIGGYKSDYKSFFTQKYHFSAGARYYDFRDFSYFVDLEYGKFKFSPSVFPQGNIAYSKYWNLSFPIEKNFSEYFHLVIRPSMDLKSIQTNMTPLEPIKTKMWDLQLQVGLRISFPLYRKCPISNCEVQKEHIHVDKKFRGQPIHKIQNPKVGENDPYLNPQKRKFLGIFKRK